MNVGPDVHVKVTVGPGWQIYGAEMRSSGFLSKCNTDASQECIVLAPIGGSVSVALFPLTDPHVVRNVTVEKVPIGTTCEE